jgi:hypothetical protein
MAEAKAKKKYRLIIHNPKFRNSEGVCEYIVNGHFYKTKENEAVELNAEQVDFFLTNKKRELVATGEDGGVDISEKGFSKKISKNFELIEV